MSEKPQGLHIYTPTRLEWLAVVLNTLFQCDNLSSDGFELYYRGIKDGETIRIVVRHYNNVNKSLMERKVRVAREAVSRYAKLYEWESWLKTELDIAEIE